MHDVVYYFGPLLPFCLLKRVLALQTWLLFIIVVGVVGLHVDGVSLVALTVHIVLIRHLEDRFVLS